MRYTPLSLRMRNSTRGKPFDALYNIPLSSPMNSNVQMHPFVMISNILNEVGANHRLVLLISAHKGEYNSSIQVSNFQGFVIVGQGKLLIPSPLNSK